MLRLPTEDCPPGPLVMAPEEELLPEEDETEEVQESSGDHPLRLLLAVSVPGLLLLGGFAWWMMPKAADRERAAAVAREQAEKIAEQEKAEKRPAVAPENLAVTVDKVSKGFLEAKTLDEVMKWVRLPEQVGPKMREWYAAEGYKAPGFRSMVGDFQYMVQDGRELVSVRVRTGDYQMRELMLVREKEGWLADWESWAPWSELSWPELRKQRPTEPKLVRAVLTEVKYYNFGFKDKDWGSYRLESLDGEHSIYGYVSRINPLNARLASLTDKAAKKPMVLHVKFPPAAPADNQVEIVDLVSENWVDLSGAPPP